MSNPLTFMNGYAANMAKLSSLLDDIRAQNDWLVQDPTMIARYFESAGARADIVPADITAAQGASNQVIFAYDSGSPTQKAAILKMIP